MAVQVTRIADAPAHKYEMTFIDDRVRKYLPTTKEKTGNDLRIDYKRWVTNEQTIKINARLAQWRAEKAWHYNFNRFDES